MSAEQPTRGHAPTLSVSHYTPADPALDGALIVSATGPLDQDNHWTLSQELADVLSAHPPAWLVLDLTGVTHLDATGVSQLQRCHSVMTGLAAGNHLRIVAPAGSPARHALTTTRLDLELQIRESLPHALSV